MAARVGDTSGGASPALFTLAAFALLRCRRPARPRRSLAWARSL